MSASQLYLKWISQFIIYVNRKVYFADRIKTVMQK